MMCRRMALTSLESIGDQNTPLGPQGGFSILAFDAAPQLDDISIELFVRGHFHYQPFKANRLVSIDRTPESDPEFEPDHRPTLGIVRRSQSEQERRCMRSTRD